MECDRNPLFLRRVPSAQARKGKSHSGLISEYVPKVCQSPVFFIVKIHTNKAQTAAAQQAVFTSLVLSRNPAWILSSHRTAGPAPVMMEPSCASEITRTLNM